MIPVETSAVLCCWRPPQQSSPAHCFECARDGATNAVPHSLLFQMIASFTHYTRSLAKTVIVQQRFMPTPTGEMQAFLQQHPQLLVGRTAWDAANLAIDQESCDTFSAISKPFPNMVVYQTISAKTNRVIVAAALIDDERAEAHYQKVARPQSGSCECPGGNCSQWQLRCYVCAWANDEPCRWDRETCTTVGS